MKLAWTMFVALALGVVAAQGAAGQVTALERAGLSGPVAHVLTEDENEDGARRLRSEARYDEAGRLLEIVSYAYDFRDGSLRSRTVTSYDAGLRLMRETLDATGAVTSTGLFRYDERDLLVEEVVYDAAGVVTVRQTYAYDAAGNVVRHEHYRGAALFRVNELTYGADGALSRHEVFDGDGVLLSEATYADGGLALEETEYDEAGAVVRRTAARLDDRGNFVETLEFDADGAVVERSTFAYDERGLLVEDRFEMDLTGRPSEYVTAYAYEFDPQGSWTVRRTLEFGDVVETLYRTIEYR